MLKILIGLLCLVLNEARIDAAVPGLDTGYQNISWGLTEDALAKKYPHFSLIQISKEIEFRAVSIREGFFIQDHAVTGFLFGPYLDAWGLREFKVGYPKKSYEGPQFEPGLKIGMTSDEFDVAFEKQIFKSKMGIRYVERGGMIWKADFIFSKHTGIFQGHLYRLLVIRKAGWEALQRAQAELSVHSLD